MIAKNLSECRDAPPIKPPSISFEKKVEIMFGLQPPPYKIERLSETYYHIFF